MEGLGSQLKRIQTKKLDYNALARKGIHYCASCQKRMKKHHYSGHCSVCRSKGY